MELPGSIKTFIHNQAVAAENAYSRHKDKLDYDSKMGASSGFGNFIVRGLLGARKLIAEVTEEMATPDHAIEDLMASRRKNGDLTEAG